MTKIFLGIIAALTIALLITGLFLKHEISQNGSLQTKYQVSQDDLKQLNKQLSNKIKIDKTTDEVVDKIHVQDVQVETKISTIQERVTNTANREAKGEITPATASSIYTDSMWRAYCQAGIPNP
jgi:hypothetical protein